MPLAVRTVPTAQAARKCFLAGHYNISGDSQCAPCFELPVTTAAASGLQMRTFLSGINAAAFAQVLLSGANSGNAH